MDMTKYKGTPTISVVDNRGLHIRTLEYNHIEESDPLDEYITRNQYDPLGSIESSIDPRLFFRYQDDSSVIPNFKYMTSLRGDVIYTDSVDSGDRLEIFDIEGRKIFTLDAKSVETSTEYDILGRVEKVFEKREEDEVQVCRERFIYGENEANSKDNNLRGQLVRHYDTAGLMETNSFSLKGNPLLQSRKLLKEIDEFNNWDGDEENTWKALLCEYDYKTKFEYNAQGNVISKEDAKGNLQKTKYNLLGKPKATSLKIKNQTEVSIIDNIKYNAYGKVERAEHGNGMLTEYTYEETTGRLIEKKDSRSTSDNKKETLQDYLYEYDPVGNIISISNKAESVLFYRNQKIEPKREYQYDALYRLISSCGRESDGDHSDISDGLDNPIAIDESKYVNYTEKYSYDRAGNLVKILHNGATPYTRNIDIDINSNKGILQNENEAPKIVDCFDKAGNQIELLKGIPLGWDTRNQLSHVSTVVREREDDDYEDYLYDGLGMRVVKRNVSKTQNSIKEDTTTYLQGLELHTKKIGETIKESLQVIVVDTGDIQVRVLHWEDGTNPEGISNDQYRFSINDQLGSSLIELDMEGKIITKEEYYPYGGTALWAARSKVEASYKTIRYSGKERDATGLYYYGHRYYMPWIGRWLNPDPAGTVDGLNLYRMVRNNPITLMDPDGNSPLNPADFSKENGDLVYGFDNMRKYYMEELYPNYKKDGTAMGIREYNNKVIDYVYDNQSIDIQEGLFSNNPQEAAKEVVVPANLKEELMKKYDSYPLWENYFHVGESNPKYNISNIYKETAEKYNSDYYHRFNKDANVLMWKRGSKIGLEIAASNKKTKIHFVLDGLNIEDVVHKTKGTDGKPGPGESVTASELRYIYRNWDRLQGQVIFYRNSRSGKKLDTTPWDENPSLWGEYTPKSSKSK